MRYRGIFYILSLIGCSLTILCCSMNVFATEEKNDETVVDESDDKKYLDVTPYYDPNRNDWLLNGEEVGGHKRRSTLTWEYNSLSEFANLLTSQYNDTRSNCSYGKAVYECSGILMRGLYFQGGDYYVPWSVSPKAQQRGNVLSFTYLRKDVGFQRFPFRYTVGFIPYPLEKIRQNGSKRIPLKPLCYFPTDGYTDYRDEFGCGKTKEVVLRDRFYVANTRYSRRCQDIGVRTFDRWVFHYGNSHKNLFYQEQCGLDLRNDKYASGNTMIGIQATRYIQNVTNTFRHPEIVTSGWPTEEEGLDVKKVPFMAFFYIDNSGVQSLQVARKMQKDYFDKTGLFVPVVRVRLPLSSVDSASFYVTRNIQSPEIPLDGIGN
ncbi:hypothetical protein ACX92S_13745 (plasmid) [Enterococcus faecalis]